MLKIILKIATILVINNLAIADVIIPTQDSDLKITIYNNNKAFINDKREAQVESGKQKLIYQGIPSAVITQSVVPSFENINTKLYSQNYIYNIISQQSMLKSSIDKSLSYYANSDNAVANPKIRTGVLLAINPVLIKDSTGFITALNNPNQVIFNSVPKDMITKPSLVWSVDVQKSGNLGIDLKYLTKNISWKSDYVLNLADKNFALKGWITIKNDSGATYKNADISVIAGEVNEVRQYQNKSYRNLQFDSVMASPSIKSESFSGYHLYKIPFKETIKDKEQKQIAFIDKKDINYQQYGQAVNNQFHNYNTRKLTFNNTVIFKNSTKNNLGLPLPSGIVRMYKGSKNGDTHFIGEARIGNTPKNEKVKLIIGKLFDIVGEKKIITFINKKHYKKIITQYTIRNQGSKDMQIRIKERLPRYGENITLDTSCKDNCSVVKKDAFNREFIVNIKAGAKYQFTSGFEVDL